MSTEGDCWASAEVCALLSAALVCTDFKCRLLILCRALSESYEESLSQKERNQ